MTITATNIEDVTRLRGQEAERIGIATNEAFIQDLRRLAPADWQALTICDPWTVTDIARHVLGAAKANASLREMMRQQTHGVRHKSKFGDNALDATNDLQVRDHLHLDPTELIDQLAAIATNSVGSRIKKAKILGRINLPMDAGGSTATGMPTAINIGELLEVIYTRDVWLHRIDIARALGKPVPLDAHIDGRIVEDVVKEWADRHGEPFDLRLSGPAGGRYCSAGDGPHIEFDAVDFCWMLSGRAEVDSAMPGAHLLAHRIVF